MAAVRSEPAPRLLRGWLARLYNYIGAATSPHRYENERHRAIQRAVLSAGSAAYVFGYHAYLGTSPSTGEKLFCLVAFAYAAASILYAACLAPSRDRGIHALHVFLACDPLVLGLALTAAPDPLAWWMVLLLVMVARVGLRYGLNAMKFELGVALVAAAMPLTFSSYWQSNAQLAISLGLMVGGAWWLFAPLSRLLERSKAFDVKAARLQSLQDSVRAKSIFLSQVSHEMKSPLQSVVAALDVFEERFKRDDDGSELLARIRRAAMTLNTQFTDLLTLARGEAGKLELYPTAFDAKELVAGIVLDLKPEAAAKGLELELEATTEPLFVVTEPRRIDQILTNLLTNAIRYTRSGKVLLRLEGYRELTGSLSFEIVDTGPGLTSEQQAGLFKPFMRFGGATSRDDGSGLGMAVVRSLVDLLGGDISVASEPGKGTSVRVTIPAELSDGVLAQRDDEDRPRILIVDNRAVEAQKLESALTSLGYECDTAIAAAVGANRLATRTYRAALINVELPFKSGADLAAETRRGNGKNCQTPLYSISSPDTLAGWTASPFNGHLVEPITRATLQRAIEPPLHAEAEMR